MNLELGKFEELESNIYTAIFNATFPFKVVYELLGINMVVLWIGCSFEWATTRQ